VENLRQIYDPKLFEQTASRLAGLMKEYFQKSQQAPLQGLPWKDPGELKARALQFMEEAPGDFSGPVDHASVTNRMETLARQFLDTNNRLHSPHYMGHQVAPSVPIAGFFEALGSASNQASGIYEMGPFPSAVERAMVQKLGSYLEWDGLDFDAIATHGGSAANLTAVLAARNVRYSDSWQAGIARAAKAGRQPAVLCSAESHYSVSRGVAIAGIGADNVIKAPIDPMRKLDDSQLTRILDQAHCEGRDVFCVVGSACTTPTGAFDRLEPLAEICRQRGIWFHVDAAHGGGLLLSRKHRHLLAGASLADSVTWDAHKMMFVPALCTFLFYRDKRHSFQAFDQDAPYLFAKDANPTLEFDSAVRTLECTKRPVAMALWSLWCTFGPGVFEALVDATIATTSEFHAMLSDAPDFEPLHLPECNILCFRYLPKHLEGASKEKISDFQAAVRKKLIQAGDFYITATRIEGAMVLRVTIMNPLTSREHLEALMQAIRRLA
jgi:L-2,4-diaminobutyrate decarboxylase